MLQLSIHACTNVRAKFEQGENSSWVDLTFISNGKETLSMTLFVRGDRAFGRALTDAINSVAKPIDAEPIIGMVEVESYDA